MNHVTVRMDHKRRPTLPAGLLAEAGIEADTVLVASVVGDGQIMLQTQQSVLTRAKDNLHAGFGRGTADGDSTADVRAIRDEDNAVSDANFERRRQTYNHPEASAQVGADLLKLLGL